MIEATRRLRLVAWAVLPTVFWVLPLDAASPAKQIGVRVQQYVEAGLFTGVVLVARGDAVLFEKAFGLADRTFGVPNSYSNSNYHLLVLILEKVTALSYGDLLTRSVLGPCGMTNSGHHGNEQDVILRLATGYMPAGTDGLEKPRYLDWSSKTGNGSLYSTARDLLAFHRALRRGTLLKPETVQASYGLDTPNRDVGMFWFHHVRSGRRSIYVGGSSPGFKAYMERFLDDDVTVVVLSNLYIAAPTPMGDDIAAILWQDAPKLPALPMRVARPRPELDRLAGSYRFGGDFFVPNMVGKVERREDALAFVYPNGSVVPLTPTATGFFDRIYRSTVRFENDALIYRNGDRDYVAKRE